eukprot:Phypoly_transcript_08478.p1 GENE.Phypoly_transcript_08478~~Phypoly_transcript_08478.p1  ORF type:complete len:369 (+),score=58.96 Phypoly_transcript_08478:73-1179(+)
MAEGIGSIRRKSKFPSLVWQLRFLVALRVALGVVCAGFIIIYWTRFLNPLLIPLSVLVVVIVVLVGAQYHLPGIVLFSLDFITGGIFASIAILLSFYILRHQGELSYYFVILLWFYSFSFALLDKTSRHVLMVKFGIIFYVVAGIFSGPPTPDFLAKTIYYIIVICLMLPSGIITFVGSIFHPIFASHLIMPEVVEIFRDFRNLQSLLAHHHALRSAARVPNPPLSLMHQKEKNWELIGEIEECLAKRMERLKAYLKDSQIEVWNQANVKELAKVIVETEKLYWLLIGKRVAIARYHPAFNPLDTLPLLEKASTEMLKYLDQMITCLERIHERSFRSWRRVPAHEWPNIEGLLLARQELHEDFKETSR